mgnify:CR=1 FL=1
MLVVLTPRLPPEAAGTGWLQLGSGFALEWAPVWLPPLLLAGANAVDDRDMRRLGGRLPAPAPVPAAGLLEPAAVLGRLAGVARDARLLAAAAAAGPAAVLELGLA